jgi:hypothetical protein
MNGWIMATTMRNKLPIQRVALPLKIKNLQGQVNKTVTGNVKNP